MPFSIIKNHATQLALLDQKWYIIVHVIRKLLWLRIMDDPNPKAAGHVAIDLQYWILIEMASFTNKGIAYILVAWTE